jgi:GT2 family glycosyltransferase
LLQASTGRRHLLDMAVRVLEHCEQDAANRHFLLPLGSGLLQAAWEEAPLDLHLITQLLSLDKAIHFLDPGPRRSAQRVAAATRGPDAAQGKALEGIAARKDYPELADYLEKAMREQPDNLFWMFIAVQIGHGGGLFDRLEGMIREHAALPAPFRDGLLADMALLRDRPEQAASLYAAARSGLPLDIWQERMGYALRRMGRTDEALAVWDVQLTRRPWHTQLWLVRDSVRRGLDMAGEFPEGRGVVLIYTWNGGDKVDQTLAALAEAEWPQEPGRARILAVNNGSDDGRTTAILEKWEQRMGGRMRLVRLPCNVGAPAARNWLLTEPESRQADWLAYLDDDLLAPPDWLRRFGTAMRAMPDHGVYGCAVARHDRPWCLQGADMHLLPPALCAGPAGMPQAPVHMQAASWGEEQSNFGQFGYTRPCVHVAGCCHVFRREAMDAAGAFDVRFSPSQVDDFEHDIRMAVAGNMPCYHRSLLVWHMLTTGLSTSVSLPKAMNAYANHLKLQSLYPRPQFDALRERANLALLQDITRRQK